MHLLSFHIIPSPETNDHQVRILMNSEDWLKNDYLGLDPPSFFQQETFVNGTLLVGRCNCGTEGCGDLIVDVNSDAHRVIWTTSDGVNFKFDKTEYLHVIESLKTDDSWEDTNRKAERLVSDIFYGSQTVDELPFEWASCRIEKNKICLSFNKDNSKQEILKFDWDGKTVNDAMNKAIDFLRSNKQLKKINR
jgi:hypothetical protein